MRNLLILLFVTINAFGQQEQLSKVRLHRASTQHEIMRDFISFLSIPNIASDSVQIQHNADWLAQYMRNHAINNVQLLHAHASAPPVVYGECITPGATKTIIFYAHYDGQPVDPLKWEKGLQPFQPVLFDNSLFKGGKQIDFPSESKYYEDNWRIYGRGASDDKAGVMAILNAFSAIKRNGLSPGVNVKFFFEGEEEAGSPHLEELLVKYADLLQSDMWIICDGPVHQSTRKQIVYGVRGDTHLELTVFGPKRPLHSGHYGNWAPNPAMQLAQLLASMKDTSGIVTIKGFYEDVIPLTSVEKGALARIPSIDDALKNELGFIRSERKDLLISSLNVPSLNINGLQSAGVGTVSYTHLTLPTNREV